MQTYETLKHSTWECKYHVVFIPKYRKKTLFGAIRLELGPVFRELSRQCSPRCGFGSLLTAYYSPSCSESVFFGKIR
jgi:putative transposase